MFELQECLQCYDSLADSNIDSEIPICKDCHEHNTKQEVNNLQVAISQFRSQAKYPEIDEIIPGKLYLGNEDASTIKEELSKRNITHVLIVGSGMKKCFENDFTYMQINIDDSMYQNISKHFQNCYDYIESGQTVFVHCAAGVSRSATVVLSYIMKKQNKSYDEAYTQVKKIRYVIRPNVGFTRQLQEYEKTLNISKEPTNNNCISEQQEQIK